MDRHDLLTEAQERASCQSSALATATSVFALGGGTCIGTICLAVAIKDDDFTTALAYSMIAGLGAMSCGAVGGVVAALIPVDPLSQEERDALIDTYNADKRRELGLPPLVARPMPH